MTGIEQDIDPGFVDAVRRAVIGMGEDDTRVVDIELRRRETLDDEEAWQVTLVLPRPRGATWDVDRTGLLKRHTRWAVSRAEADHHVELEGFTSVILTTRDPDPEQTAPSEDPEPGEGLPGRGNRPE